MPYIHVENFSGGLDDRKSALTAAPGTLSYLNNAHLTAGGEIEKRKAFVPLFTFPPDTPCLGGWPGVGKSWLFGNGFRPVGLPAEFQWIDLRRAGVPATRVVRAQTWGDEPRVLAEYPGGARYWWAGSTIVDTSDIAVWDWPGLDPTKIQDIAVLGQKLYTVQGSVLEVSGVAEPEKHGVGATGSAVFDASKFGPKSYDLVGLGIYQNRLVTFGKNGAVVWQVDPDEAQTQPLQFLNNFGCVAPRTITEYGEVDTFFLSYSGVRSVRARDSSNTATVGDVGSPINDTVSKHLELLLDSGKLLHGVGAVEPRSGRYWMALFDVIYVLSFYPSAKISAWSTYTPGFPVVDMWALNNTMFVLSNDTLYTYGAYNGNAASDYDLTAVEIELPYLDAGDPATTKVFTGFDMACTGKWQAFAGFNTNQPAADEIHNIVRGNTYDQGVHGLEGQGTHIKIRLRSEFRGYAKVSDLAIHYDGEESG